MDVVGEVNQALTLRRGPLPLNLAIPGALLVAACIGVCLWRGSPYAALNLGMGAFFTGMAATADPTTRRRPQMLLIGVMLALGTLLGGWFGQLGPWSIVVLAVLALPAGFLAAAGPRPAAAGTIFLAMSIVNEGIVPPIHHVPAFALFSLLGSLLMLGLLETWALLTRHRPQHPEADAPTHTLLREHLHWNDPFVNHAIRLAVAEAVGATIAHIMGIEHGYWIPLTIAFVLLPDRSGTARQVVSRLIGTMLGIGLVLAPLAFGPQPELMTTVAALIGAFIALALGQINYGFAVAGLTITILPLDAVLGQGILETAPVRSMATIVAGVICGIVWLVAAPDRRRAALTPGS